MANNAFFKFFQDLVLSGTWRKLTPSARTLYPVLAIHTDKNFSPVWPSLRRLKELSGLGNSGIASAIRSLQENGLIRVWSGKHKDGNRPNVYEFVFEYEGCQIDLAPPRGKATPGAGQGIPPQRGKATPATPPTLAPSQDNLAPQKGTNKKQRTKAKEPTTSTTIHGDVHINIDHGPKPAVVDSLRQFFTDALAKELADKYPPDYIQEKIEITRYNHERGKVRNPAAYLRRALSQNYSRPPDLTTEADRARQALAQEELRGVMERIRKGEITIARHRATGQVSLVDVPADLAYIILQSRRGTRCINTWEEAQDYDFE